MIGHVGYWEQMSAAPVIKLGIERGWWAKEDEIVYSSVHEDLRPAREHGLPSPIKWIIMFLQRFDQRILSSLQLEPRRCVDLDVVVEI